MFSGTAQLPVQMILYFDYSGEDIIDVTSVDPVVSLAYDEKKVCTSYIRSGIG